MWDLFYVGVKKKKQIGFAVEFWAAKKEILYTHRRAEQFLNKFRDSKKGNR